MLLKREGSEKCFDGSPRIDETKIFLRLKCFRHGDTANGDGGYLFDFPLESCRSFATESQLFLLHGVNDSSSLVRKTRMIRFLLTTQEVQRVCLFCP